MLYQSKQSGNSKIVFYAIQSSCSQPDTAPKLAHVVLLCPLPKFHDEYLRKIIEKHSYFKKHYVLLHCCQTRCILLLIPPTNIVEGCSVGLVAMAVHSCSFDKALRFVPFLMFKNKKINAFQAVNLSPPQTCTHSHAEMKRKLYHFKTVRNVSKSLQSLEST